MKSNKALVAALMGVALAFSAPAAFAQARGAAANTGWYIGGDVGNADFGSDDDMGFRVLGGYQINRNFAAELGYHNLGEITASAGTASATTKARLWELVGIGAYPFANQFSVYGKLGGYRSKTTASSNVAGLGGEDTNTGLTYGFGAQWDAMQNLGVRVEWQRYDNVGGNASGEGDINVLSLGGIWRFR
jgi:OmpA-OmpF porin, OOP family